MPTGSNELSGTAPDIYPMPSFASLLVRDLEASIAWYRDVLGFQMVISFPQMAHIRWIKYADLLLRPGEVEQERGRGVTISFQTPLGRIDALAARAAEAGGRILSEPTNRPWNTRDFTVADPDGYRLCFTGGPVNPDMTLDAITARMRTTSA
jgi:catechol 2,3-dioxygenase-like lactoylglutathione lyase family enzyme